MKKYLFSLICSALASAAWADAPAATVLPPATATANVTPVSATTVTAAVKATAAPVLACPSGGCCQQTKTVCVPQPATELKIKVLFSSGCETLCHRGISFALFSRKGDCDSCPEGTCGHTYVRRDLYKRVEKTECPTFKRVPTQVPVCAGNKCAAPCTTSSPCASASTTVPSTTVTVLAPLTPVTPPLATLAITTPPAPQATTAPVNGTPVSATKR